MRKPIIIGLACALLYILYATFTGGAVCENSMGFGGLRTVAFTDELKGGLWIDPNHSGWGIPFLGFYYRTHLPCALRVEIADEEKKYVGIEIDTIVVEYASGEKNSVHIQWNRELKPYTLVNSSSHGIIRTPVLMLSDVTPKVVEHYSDCVVTLVGFLTAVSGEHVPFKVVETFKCESRFRMYTFWQMMASA